ncbi:hypothetical protein H5410_020949 [Solanum commersonii]|uniref:Uncharacterized protein n=1 Tax=Solanum commersonii TaxID=4109 RepID=A0A9J5ZDR8_SOLCO|nr:hypothetical protein H5410_020949 [Solanum commersonii]
MTLQSRPSKRLHLKILDFDTVALKFGCFQAHFRILGSFQYLPLGTFVPNVKETYMRDTNMANSAHIGMQQCTYTSFQNLNIIVKPQ